MGNKRLFSKTANGPQMFIKCLFGAGRFCLDIALRRCYNFAFPFPALYQIYWGNFDEVNVIGYCVRCRAKQEMLSATRTLMKNGRRAMIGTCACCGTKMSVAGKWDDDPVQPAPQTGENGLLGPPKNG